MRLRFAHFCRCLFVFDQRAGLVSNFRNWVRHCAILLETSASLLFALTSSHQCRWPVTSSPGHSALIYSHHRQIKYYCPFVCWLLYVCRLYLNLNCKSLHAPCQHPRWQSSPHPALAPYQHPCWQHRQNLRDKF